MKLREWIAGKLGITRSLTGWAGWLQGREMDLRGPGVLFSAMEQVSTVYACISLIAETISAIPVKLEESAGEVRTGVAPVTSALIERPHPHLDFGEFVELVVSWLLLRGEVFLVPVHGTGIAVLGPENFQEIILGRELAGWRHTGAHPNDPVGPRTALPEEVVQVKLPNPFNFWRGLSPLSAASVAAQMDYAAGQFMRGAMLNNADTGLIVSSEKPLTSEQRSQIEAALRERKRSAGTADLPMFLSGCRVEKPAVSAADLNHLGNRAFARKEICAVYKVPQELLGFNEDANKSIGQEMRLNFIENRIVPLCGKLERALTLLHRRMSPGSRASVRFLVNEHPVMQAARRSRIASAEILVGLGVSMRGANEFLGLGLKDTECSTARLVSTRFQNFDQVVPM